MPYPVQTYPNFAALLAYINNTIVTNGNEEIDAVDMNNVVNGLLTFITQSPINWQKAQIVSTAIAATASRPVVLFMTTAATSLSFSDNIYNQYCFINTTNSDIPLLTPAQYFDINLSVVTKIPAKSIVNISKANNNAWVVNSVPSSGSQPGLPPLVFVVDRGQPDDPVSGTSIWQNNKLKGLGAANNNFISIMLDSGIITNYGANKNMEYNATTGTIDLAYNGNNAQWNAGSGGSVDLNQ